MIRDPKNHPRAKRIDLERLRKLRLSGHTNAAIAKALGCSTALVSRLALRMGLPRRASRWARSGSRRSAPPCAGPAGATSG